MTQSVVGHKSLSFIIQSCHKESQQGQNNEQGYCLELFRRALEEHENEAWNAILEQYRNLVVSWLRRTSNYALSDNTYDDLFQDTLMRFWRTTQKHTIPLSSHFQHIGALLKYLSQCATTTCLDHLRRQGRIENLQQKLESFEREHGAVYFHIDTREAEMDRGAQIDAVREWVEQEVTDHQEAIVLKMSYELGLKPREIAEHYPQDFATVNEVHQVKKRILKRLRRAFLD